MTPRRLARDLAQQARELGGRQTAALAVFGRLLVPSEADLIDLVARLPPAARAAWKQALNFPASFSVEFDRERLWAEISRTAQPVLPEGYLFELFLRELDRGQHHRRGVYYTPQPLVRFITRSVARLAGEHFPGQPLHLIDPACGYGAFLVETAPRLAATMQVTGIELCPITWAMAHLLLSREAILLNVNPLAAGESLRETILGRADHRLVPLIVGNPPWSNFGRLNRSPWLSELLADYRAGLAERKANLTDDAIKFIRWGQYWIDQAGAGILAFVTPNTWLTGLTHRRMRESLLASFDELFICDLHGEADGPAGDENVFGVRSGVAIVVMVKDARATSTQHSVLSTQYMPSEVQRFDLVGSRDGKFDALADLDGLNAVCLHPTAPDFSLARPTNRASCTSDYASFWPLNRIFRHYVSGVQTKNDALFVGFTREELEVQVRQWLASQREPPEFDPQYLRPYLVAPFDRRWIYYDPRLIGRPRLAVMRHMLRPNLGLVFMRQSTCPGEYDHFLAVDCLVSDRVFYSRHGAPFLAPLWLVEKGDRGQGTGDRGKADNFDGPFVTALQATVGSTVQPLDLFHYLYAVAYSPTYRRTFADELRRGFPRLPLPADAVMFSKLAALGGQLLALHVGGACSAAPEAGLLPADGDREPFRLGGYDVLRRWRTPRRRRGWRRDDEGELAWLASIGRETRRLMQEIDGTQSVPAI